MTDHTRTLHAKFGASQSFIDSVYADLYRDASTERIAVCYRVRVDFAQSSLTEAQADREYQRAFVLGEFLGIA